MNGIMPVVVSSKKLISKTMSDPPNSDRMQSIAEKDPSSEESD